MRLFSSSLISDGFSCMTRLQIRKLCGQRGLHLRQSRLDGVIEHVVADADPHAADQFGIDLHFRQQLQAELARQAPQQILDLLVGQRQRAFRSGSRPGLRPRSSARETVCATSGSTARRPLSTTSLRKFSAAIGSFDLISPRTSSRTCSPPRFGSPTSRATSGWRATAAISDDDGQPLIEHAGGRLVAAAAANSASA